MTHRSSGPAVSGPGAQCGGDGIAPGVQAGAFNMRRAARPRSRAGAGRWALLFLFLAGQVVAVTGHDHVVQRGLGVFLGVQVVPQLRQQVLRGDRHARAAVGHVMGQLVAAVHRVHRHHHRIGPQDGVVAQHPLRAVLQIQQHAVARLHATHVFQVARQPRGLVVELGEAQLGAVVDQEGLVGVAAGRDRGVVKQVGLGQREVPGQARGPVGVAGQICGRRAWRACLAVSGLCCGFRPGALAGQLFLGDGVAVHLVRAVGEAQGAGGGVGLGEAEVVAHTGAAVHLHGPVDHLQRHGGRGDLDHGDFLARLFVADLVHLPGGVQHQEARLVDHDARLGDALAGHALVGDAFAKGGALRGALAHLFQRALGAADDAHAMVDAARAEAALGDLEAAAFAEQDVGRRHAHVGELHFGMAVGRVVVAEHRQVAQHLDAGRVHRHQDHRLLRMLGRFGVGLAHEDHDLAARVVGAGGPPLAAVDHVVIAIALDAGFDVGGVAGGHGGFGHGEGRADLAGQQGLEPLLLLLGRAVAHEGFHVAGVGRGAVEGLGADGRAAHDFGQRRVFEVAQAGAHVRLGQEQVPQAFGLGLGFQVFHDLGLLPGVAGGAEGVHLRGEQGLGRVNVLGHEGCDARLQRLNLGGVVEIHGVSW